MAAVTGAVVLSGCAGQGVVRQATDAQAPGTPSAGARGGPSHSVTRPPDPLAPQVLPPVVRPGEPRPSKPLTASPVSYHSAAVYGDGVRLQVVSIAQGSATGKGVGVITGPHTSFSVQLTNGGSRTIDLSNVVVTAVYGDPGRIARPVYDSGAEDFSGLLAGGRSARARYSFAIPVADLGHVTIHIDFDNRHAAATFRGNAS